MAKSTSRSIFLDTSAAQTAADKLTKRVQFLDKELENTNLSQKRRDELSKQRLTAEEQRLKVVEQINKGLGSTYNQFSQRFNTGSCTGRAKAGKASLGIAEPWPGRCLRSHHRIGTGNGR
jgi:hypothetical protein